LISIRKLANRDRQATCPDEDRRSDLQSRRVARQHASDHDGIDQEALAKLRKENQPSERPRQYINPPVVNPGMFYVPR